ncbi:division plane positioning ATPase MipZ [Candidatus Enterovibrio escicola]|uniref:CobQ/CobB/MinD/ParA nucleotide binding domain-containing protein n=2 Tax=Candidatus Enterovibrio escicola TaxID=1927127 RepID=A0A2A5T1S6_9GAMM|nr:division plane positioning ATPase MipZ [Candidatus Enterovibrio escacola]PCS22113.1 hypothetical protein BTN49_2307 [Candidatus Enterovibrio escacola]
MIIVIGGDKGGTGKTILTANLAVFLMKKGKTVTVVKLIITTVFQTGTKKGNTANCLYFR